MFRNVFDSARNVRLLLLISCLFVVLPACGARFGSGSAPVGDSLATATTLGASGVAGRLSGRWAVALLAQRLGQGQHWCEVAGL